MIGGAGVSGAPFGRYGRDEETEFGRHGRLVDARLVPEVCANFERVCERPDSVSLCAGAYRVRATLH